jgi:hypothetical protein
MAMQLSFSNLFQFFGAISPLLLTTCLVLISCFNQDVKGFVYLGGILIAGLINVVLQNTLKVKPKLPIQPSCNMIEFPFNLNEYDTPSFNTMWLSFTLFYLLMPMVYISSINIGIVLFVSALLTIDAVTKFIRGCTQLSGIGLGFIVGGLLGLLWFILMYSSGNKNLLYFNLESSDNVMCSRPSKQTFKCSVYRNGQVISSSIA